jgi:transposase
MQVYLGIDWSTRKHAAYFTNERAAALQYLEVEHSVAGLNLLDAARHSLGVSAEDCIVGIETAHTLLLDFLAERHYRQIYVLHPNIVKSAQGRFRQSGAKDDRADARLIADLLRTDLHRLVRWQPDSELTCQIRARISLVHFLTHQAVATRNRLWAVLMRYYPAALETFSSLDALVALSFIQAFPTPQAANQLSYADFTTFLANHHHRRPTDWPKCFARLHAPQPSAHPNIVSAYAPQAAILATILENLFRSKYQLLEDTSVLFLQHPDAPIFASLPGAGKILQPALLVKFGDNRLRFPSPASVQQVAGTSPITRRSGKSKVVLFRLACDHDFRNIAQEWARASTSQSPWAAAYFKSVCAHTDSATHAYRCLANRWLAILWKLWQSCQPYDESFHLQQHFQRSLPLPIPNPALAVP